MTHFYPKPKFFSVIQRVLVQNDLSVVFEAGGGEFKNFAGYKRHGIKHLGCDPWFEPTDHVDLINRVLPVHVHRCSVVKQKPMLIVVCRPDHSGWARNIVHYMHKDSVLLYVGLAANLYNDLRDVQIMHEAVGVGRDGECAWIARSQSLPPAPMSYESIVEMASSV